MQTTLNQIRKHSPCVSGWEKLLKYLGKTMADDEPLSITTIIDSNGVDDAIWCLRAVEGHDKEIRLFAVWCARQVQHLLKDQRSLYAIDTAERYANGEATDAELKDAWEAAWENAKSTDRYADMAATAAAEAPARATRAAMEGAWWAVDAAMSAAAGVAAGYAARDAAWCAAKYIARAKQADELRRICKEVKG